MLGCFPTRGPDKQYNKLVGVVSKGTIYRASTVLSVWKRNVLEDLLKSGESAWEFEIYGTARSDKFGDFYSTWENYFPVINGVIKGKWQRSAVNKLQSLGLFISLKGREIMTTKESIGFFFKKERASLLNLFPPNYRRKIKDFFLIGGYKYKRRP